MVKDRKIHILFLITSLRYGGAERVVSNLSSYFAGLGRYRVSIMLLEDGVDYPISDKVGIIRLHSSLGNLFLKIFSLIRDPFRLKDFVRKEGVDIVLSFMQRPNTINMLSKVFGARYVSFVNVRCCIKKHYETEYKNIPYFIKSISKSFLKGLWRYADKTICNSNVIKDEIMTLFGVNSEDVEVIYNPLNLEEIEDRAKEVVDENWFNKKDIPIIVNVGSLTKPKGHDYLLRSFSILASKRPVRLVLIGDGELRKGLVEEVQKLDIADKVFFMGWRSNPYKYVARSDVYVSSSTYEGFPNVLLEAMACGCPVVATNCLSGPSEILMPEASDKGDIVKARYGMLVNTMTETNLSKAIECMLDNKDVARRFTERGFKRARDFNAVLIGDRYEKRLLEGFKAKRYQNKEAERI